MSGINHPTIGGPKVESTDYYADHTIANGTITAAMLSASYDASGAAAAAQAASQPMDADLTAIAALTTTSYGRAFLVLADAPAGITALGLGTAATQASSAFDAAGAAAAALVTAEAYTDSAVSGGLTQAQVFARACGS